MITQATVVAEDLVYSVALGVVSAAIYWALQYLN
jgi:hypothetical protein